MQSSVPNLSLGDDAGALLDTVRDLRDKGDVMLQTRAPGAAWPRRHGDPRHSEDPDEDTVLRLCLWDDELQAMVPGGAHTLHMVESCSVGELYDAVEEVYGSSTPDDWLAEPEGEEARPAFSVLRTRIITCYN